MSVLTRGFAKRRAREYKIHVLDKEPGGRSHTLCQGTELYKT